MEMTSPSSSSGATLTSDTPEAVSTAEEKKRDKEVAHKTKLIQFLGRNCPIILQNDNGPCPLLAICNVLLLKNQLNLSTDIPEISQEKLLSLVAERLLDSNSNIDKGYLANQQQNMSDAIDLLPRLATGIDVNIKFRRVDDFEYTPECAIFDLLGIPLYHGWIVDPQDHDTASAIGSKSYNTLVEELVALETQNMDTVPKENSEEECVDFAAATTATLGVPSPCLSRGRSFDDSPVTLSDCKMRKGDIEEEAELLRILNLSESVVSISSECNAPSKSEPVSLIGMSGKSGLGESNDLSFHEASTSIHCDDLIDLKVEGKDSKMVLEEGVCSSPGTEQASPLIQATFEQPVDLVTIQEISANPLVRKSMSYEPGVSTGEGNTPGAVEHENNRKQVASTSEILCTENLPILSETSDKSNILVTEPDSDSSTGRSHSISETEDFLQSVEENEPIYEGEENIIESGTTANQSREPMYEGEVILAEQGGSGYVEAYDCKKEEITPKEGELIRNFLRNSASQLTVCGLFRLRDDLKERELCVFFRNNHFNTMFKFEGELYILATDQGFINQPGIVWEKLNEVNGDTVYMTCNFKEFNGENHDDNAWDEQIARASTAEFLANSAQEDMNYDADLKLARDLQQQEFDRYPAQPQYPPEHQGAVDGSRLIVGPQGPRNNARPAHSSKQESKSSKDKCTLM